MLSKSLGPGGLLKLMGGPGRKEERLIPQWVGSSWVYWRSWRWVSGHLGSRARAMSDLLYNLSKHFPALGSVCPF